MDQLLKTAIISEGNLRRLFAGGGAMGRRRLMTAAFAATVLAMSSVSAAHSEVWTYNGSGTGDPGGNWAANYDAANAWKDANGTVWTFDTAATVARDYIVPAGKTLVSHKDTDGYAGEWRFTANDDTFILRGSSTAVAHLRSSARRLYLPLLVMENNSKLSLGLQDPNPRWYQTVLGNIRIDASEEYPALFQCWDYYDGTQTNATTMTGAGALVYSGKTTGGVGTATNGRLYLYDCDASGFTGPVKMQLPADGTSRGRTAFYVKSAENIGGNPAAFMQKGLELAGVYLEVQGNVALPANRGLYIASHSCKNSSYTTEGLGSKIGIAGGRTFSVATPVVFESADYNLYKSASGTLAVPGWTANGTVWLAGGTLDITGASVASGAVSPASIGTLKMTGGTVRLTLSGDGSELADGQYVLLTAAARLPDAFATLEPVVNGAFTLPAGKKAMYSVLNGTNFVMTVKDDCPTWTFTSTNTGNGNYAVANAWTDENNATQTLTSDSTTRRDYVIPAGKTLKTPSDSSVNWSFTSCADDTFILRGSSASQAKIESRVADLNVGYLRMMDNSNLSFSEKDYASARGTISVEASEDYPAIFFVRNWQLRHATNATTIVGSGALVYTHPASTYNQNVLFLKGDASGFTGPLVMKGIDGTTDQTIINGMNRLAFAFTESANIAGNPSSFIEKGLALGGVRLFALGDSSLGANRGLYVSSNFTNKNISAGSEICVKSGCTFAVPAGVSFESADYPLVLTSNGSMGIGTIGGGTFSLPGWAANGTVKVTTGTLNITGASVTNGVVTPASIGSLVVSGGAVKIVVTGDGSEVNLGDVKTLIDCGGTLDDGVADYLQFVNDGAFTFAPGTKASLSIEDGKVKMSVVGYVPEWTLNTNDRAYTTASVWTDETGAQRTWTAETAATKIEYFVPAGMTVMTPTGDLSTDLYAISTHPDSTVTVRNGGCFQSNVMYAYVPNLVLESGATLHFWIARNNSSNFRSARSVAGTLRIEASESNPAVIMSRGHFSDPIRTNAMDMVGSGAVYYTRYSDAGTDGIFYATGDNSGFTGPLAVKDASSKTDKRMFLHVSSSENIGGNPEAYTEKGLQLHSAQLMVHGDVALGSNRGFYVSSNSVVNVDSGKSFTSPNAVVFTEGTTLSKTGAGTMSVPGWTTGTVAVSAGTLNLVGATFANGAAETPVAIGGIEYAGGATVTLTVTGDGSALPFANATNVLVEAESALPAGFAGKIRIVNDNAFTVPLRLKTKLVVVDGTKLALETEKRKGTVLVVR